MSIERTRKTTELIELTLNDVVVSVEEDGTVDYEDRSVLWAYPEGSHRKWYETFGTEQPADFIDAEDVAEDAKELFSIMVPYEVGKYSISCNVSLVYDVRYTEEIYRFRDGDEIGEDIEDTYVNDVELDEDESEVTDFKCVKAY